MWETQFQSDVKCTKTEKKNINGNTIGKSLYKDNLLNLIYIIQESLGKLVMSMW